MESFQNIRKEYFKNPRKIVKYLELDYFVLSEKKKNDENFLSQQFIIVNFEIRARKDGDCHKELSDRVLFVKDKQNWSQII